MHHHLPRPELDVGVKIFSSSAMGDGDPEGDDARALARRVRRGRAGCGYDRGAASWEHNVANFAMCDQHGWAFARVEAACVPGCTGP